MAADEAVSKEENKLSEKAPPSCLTNLSFYFTEYCNNTTIHGLKFLGERGRSPIEKIWWLIFVGLSLYGCIALILDTYDKWMNSPVIVSFATSETPIWRVPFPAITICPLIKIDPIKLNISLDDVNSDDKITKLKYLSLICPDVLELFPQINATETLDDRAIEFLISAAPDFDKIILSCQWSKGSCNFNTDQYFTPILTSGGVCYTFNMLDRNEIFTNGTDFEYYQNLNINHQPPSNWSVEDGYPEDADLTTYPRRTLLIGTNGGLELVLRTSLQESNYSCHDALQGYKVILHHPSRLPRFHQHYFWVPLNELVSVSVKANMISTSKELREYDPEDRKCFLKMEKTLRFFRVYNQQNCLLECLANYTLQKCDCVGFYMPRTNETPICGPGRFEFVKEANSKIYFAFILALTKLSAAFFSGAVDFIARQATFQMRRLRRKTKSRGKTRRLTTDCNCLPACHSLHFDAETSQLNWDWRKDNRLRNLEDNQTIQLSKLRIFFKDLQFMTSERNELYGQTEFWANCGGLLGLFTGFSFISLLEIIYFATLRFACNVRKYGWNYWSGADDLLLEVKVKK